MKEYLILEAWDKEELQNQINQKAKENWNLVSYQVSQSSKSSLSHHAIMEREIELNPSQR